MERSRAVLITLICVLFSRISGAEVERRVRPGDDITLYCDCVWETGFSIVWFRNSSREHQPHFIMSDVNLMLGTLPRYSVVWNPSSKTFDLRVKNITESDLGLYYCAVRERKDSEDKTGIPKDVYHYGKTTTRLTFLDITVPFVDPPQTTPTPPVSDCSVCWKLLVSVCPVCVLLSSTCVFCICRNTNKADRNADRRGKMKLRKSNEVGDDDVCYASLDVPSGEEKWLKKKRVESSDLCTYSEVKFEKM